MEPRLAFAAAFAGALEQRGVGLTWLRDRLADRGHQVSLEAVDAIEELLDLEAGRLSGHLRRRDRSGPTPFDELVGLARQVGQDRGLVGEDAVDRLVVDLVIDVDERGRVTRVRVTQVVVAAREGADSVTMFVAPGVAAGTTAFDVPDEADTRLEAVSGCTVDDVVHVVDGISAAALRFDRPLALGESVVTEVLLVPLTDEAADDPEWGAVAEQRLESSMVWVRFHPDRLPSRTWVGFQEAGITHEWEVRLDGATGLLHRQTDFGPGVLTARWEW